MWLEVLEMETRRTKMRGPVSSYLGDTSIEQLSSFLWMVEQVTIASDKQPLPQFLCLVLNRTDLRCRSLTLSHKQLHSSQKNRAYASHLMFGARQRLLGRTLQITVL